VKGYKALAHITAVGMIVGVASAPINQSAHADVTLLSADDPLAGSDTAIILGGTFEPTPSTSFAQTAEDLYLHPLGFDGGAIDSAVCDMVGTDPCSAPLQVLTTPELTEEGPSTVADVPVIVQAVENEFNADPGAFSAANPLTVFGYSQSATAESIAMTQLAQDGIPSDELHFVFIGDPSTPGGVSPNLEPDLAAILGPSIANFVTNLDDMKGAVGIVTPDDLYPVTIYTLDTDGIADFQEDFKAGGLSDADVHQIVQHLEYLGLTPAEVANATTSTDGDITYIDISDNINNSDAWFSAFEHGIGSSGLFESIFDSLQYALTGVF
jgi:PE-PPE domain